MTYRNVIGAAVALALVSSGSTAVAGSEPCRVIDRELAQGSYTGGCRDGLAEGYGKVSGAGSYEGYFHEGKKHGKGIKIMPNGDRYEGEFSDDYRQGKGVYVWGNRTPWAGDRYEGEYQRDLRHGRGLYQWSNGDRYDGAWKDDLRLGPSVMEQRRSQAAEAAAKAVKVGAQLCAEQKWDRVNEQLVRGTIEGMADGMVRVRITEIEGGLVNYQGNKLTVGDVFLDDARHWEACGQI